MALESRPGMGPIAAAILALGAATACSDAGSGGRPAASARALPSPAAAGSALPNLTRGPDGTVALSWVQTGTEETVLRFATLTPAAWSAPHDVARGADWFVNWADYPSVVPLGGSRFAAHWLQKSGAQTYAYDVAITRSEDGGRSWHEALIPHTDGTPTEHGFVSLFPSPGGVGALWLDGRNMGDGGHSDDGHGGEGAMTLRALTLDAGERRDGVVLDERVCECCQTGAAVTQDGPVAVYRDRSIDEIRDIYVVRALGERWQPPAPVADDGWQIAGCPVNGPAIDAAGADVAVAWFTEANGHARVRVAFSHDAAATFGTPVDVDGDAPLGRVDVALLHDGAAAVSWLAADTGGGARFSVRRIAPGAAPGPVVTIARTSAARTSGFGHIVRAGSRLVFAWTDIAGETNQVRTAQLDTNALSPARRPTP